MRADRLAGSQPLSVLFVTIGDETVASSRVRVLQYVPHLERAGIRSRVVIYRGSKAARAQALARMLWLAPQHRVVVVQKAYLPIPAQWLLAACNPRLVFDFDDALYTADPLWPAALARLVSDLGRPRLEHVLARSRLALTASDATAAFAARLCPRVLRIPGPIDTDRYVPAPRATANPERTVVGWIGSPFTTPYVKTLLPGFAELARRHPQVAIRLIGADRFEVGNLPVTFTPWSLATECAELRSLDIGLMPLPDNEWTRGKGGYKLLQYMAVGIAAVASPVGINREILRDGVNGFWATTEAEWVERLHRLITDRHLREEMGRRGRAIAENEYSFHRSAPVLIAALRRVAAAGRRAP